MSPLKKCFDLFKLQHMQNELIENLNYLSILTILMHKYVEMIFFYSLNFLCIFHIIGCTIVQCIYTWEKSERFWNIVCCKNTFVWCRCLLFYSCYIDTLYSIMLIMTWTKSFNVIFHLEKNILNKLFIHFFVV
jgi:hypothetical protein